MEPGKKVSFTEEVEVKRVESYLDSSNECVVESVTSGKNVAEGEAWNIDKDDPRKLSKIIHGKRVIHYRGCHVYVVEHLLDDVLCDDLIQVIKKLPLTKTTYCHGNNVLCFMMNMETLLDNQVKSYYPLSTHEHEVEQLLAKSRSNESIRTNKWNGVTHQHMETLLKRVNEHITTLETIMKEVNNKLCFTHNSGFQLRKIYGPTKPHSDGIKRSDINRCCLHHIPEKGSKAKKQHPLVRNSSAIIALNDEFVSTHGATFRFPDHDLSVQLPKGSIILFPPFWTHPHEVSDARHQYQVDIKPEDIPNMSAENIDDRAYRFTLSTWFCELIDD